MSFSLCVCVCVCVWGGGGGGGGVPWLQEKEFSLILKLGQSFDERVSWAGQGN